MLRNVSRVGLQLALTAATVLSPPMHAQEQGAERVALAVERLYLQRLSEPAECFKLGAQLEPVQLSNEAWGFRLQAVQPGCAAADTGLLRGDVIIELDGPFASSDGLLERIRQHAEESVAISIVRGDTRGDGRLSWSAGRPVPEALRAQHRLDPDGYRRECDVLFRNAYRQRQFDTDLDAIWPECAEVTSEATLVYRGAAASSAADRYHAAAQADIGTGSLAAARDNLALAVAAARHSAEFYQAAHEGGAPALGEMVRVMLEMKGLFEEELEVINGRIQSELPAQAQDAERLALAIERLSMNRLVESPQCFKLGGQLEPVQLSDGAWGFRLLAVQPGCAAADSGLRRGDVIMEIDGPFASGEGVLARIAQHSEESVAIAILRGDTRRDGRLTWSGGRPVPESLRAPHRLDTDGYHRECDVLFRNAQRQRQFDTDLDAMWQECAEIVSEAALTFRGGAADRAASRYHAAAVVDVERDCLPAARDSLILAVAAARQSADFYQLAHDGGNALLSELADVGLRKQAVLEEELERIEERIRSDAGWLFGVPRRTRCPTPE